MRIRILRNLGHGLPPYREGGRRDVGHAEAERLLGMGLAEPVPPDPAPEPAAPESPADGPPRKKKKQQQTAEPPAESPAEERPCPYP